MNTNIISVVYMVKLLALPIYWGKLGGHQAAVVPTQFPSQKWVTLTVLNLKPLASEVLGSFRSQKRQASGYKDEGLHLAQLYAHNDINSTISL